MSAQRDTSPGPLLRGYKKLKSKIAGLAERAGGTVKAGTDWKTAGNEDTPDEVRSQEEMKAAFGGGDAASAEGKRDASQMEHDTAIYEEVVPEATRQKAEADAARDADIEDAAADRGDVELEGPALRAEERGAPRDAGLPPAARTDDAPSMTDLDRRALQTLAEDEVGRAPTDGMGLDDAPRDAKGNQL